MSLESVRLTPDMSKDLVLTQLADASTTAGLNVIEFDDKRPWGGELVFDPNDKSRFLELFFRYLNPNIIDQVGFGLKYLVLAPSQRFSWQYHERRSEIWRVLFPLGIYLSEDDICPPTHDLKSVGQQIKADCGMRHRLAGDNNWGAVAEIWVHNDLRNPSDEADIIRLQDDYGR
jgi:mannose-6-phosphate isomerase